MGLNSLIKTLSLLILVINGCTVNVERNSIEPKIRVSENKRYLEYHDGKPFFWLGGTSWGMSEWLTREEIKYYLDNRKEKDFNLVQVCVFWGKREENPVNFTFNPTNAYGFKAFAEENGIPNSMKPNIVKGGNAEDPNDYWDHVEFIIQEADKREMIVALLPVWGRRYVNAVHDGFSNQFFSVESMKSYGTFLGSRFKNFDNIIWILGGDVKADAGSNYLFHYRSMAEGIINGITGEQVKWNENSSLWDKALITYHPDGSPFRNSSTWFHKDPWLDFNMIETYKYRDSVYRAVTFDYLKDNPIKPTVMGEPSYEGAGPDDVVSNGINMRRQAFHSFFAGAAGFTYGGKIDKKGNGPLWSPYEGWKDMLDMEGAITMKNVKRFCFENGWPNWIPDNSLLEEGLGKGEFQKVGIRDTLLNSYYIYFPDNSEVSIDFATKKINDINIQWYNPFSGNYTKTRQVFLNQNILDIIPPEGWMDAVLVLKFEE